MRGALRGQSRLLALRFSDAAPKAIPMSRITLHLRYHAAARELTGLREEDLVCEGPLTGKAVIAMLGERHPALQPYLGRFKLARNGAFAANEAEYGDGDRIDLLPPVAGGSPRLFVALRESPLSIDEAYAAVQHPRAGAVAVFTGVVRNHAEGKAVARLDYEAHEELADAETRRILEELCAADEGLRMAAIHRIGSLQVGDIAIVVAASSPHRAEAFRACRQAIDLIKETVPIWKKEWGPEGEAHWVNLSG